MKSFLKRALVLLILLGLCSTASAIERKASWSKYAGMEKPPYPSSETMTSKEMVVSSLDRVSYSIGMSIGEDILSRDITINPDMVARGIRDMVNGRETALSKDDAVKVLTELQEKLMARQRDKLAMMARKNLQEGQAFLEQNAKRDGVQVTDSGLQYEILIPGTGATPTAEDTVVVDYRGQFIDGKEFDSSYQRGEPAELSVGGIIPGWSEALLMMKEGAKWRLYVPSELAYGAQGAPPVIEPNSTLIFDVELKSIRK